MDGGKPTSFDQFRMCYVASLRDKGATTYWNLIREMMAAVIDSFEQFEAAGYTELDRSLTVDISGKKVSIYEIMVSAWTLPENLRYRIIRRKGRRSLIHTRSFPGYRENGRSVLGVDWCWRG